MIFYRSKEARNENNAVKPNLSGASSQHANVNKESIIRCASGGIAV